MPRAGHVAVAPFNVTNHARLAPSVRKLDWNVWIKDRYDGSKVWQSVAKCADVILGNITKSLIDSNLHKESETHCLAQNL